MARDPELVAHQEWLGYVQPVGLVVSPAALLANAAHVDKNIVPVQARLLEAVERVPLDGADDPVPVIADLPGFFRDVFGWQDGDLVKDARLEGLEVVLGEYNETLRPTYAVEDAEPGEDGARPWLMLVQEIERGLDLDAVHETDEHRWQASPQARFERLLRENQVPIGLLSNGASLRLVYAPRAETSGHATFRVADMTEVSGRPILAGLHMLLGQDRIWGVERKKSLPGLLEESRKYQNTVSTQLAEQVLEALYELLRGFQAANDQTKGELLRRALQEDPDHVYGGLLAVLMRLVFTLYAEDRGLLPMTSGVYVGHYSVAGLFERLRSDWNRYPDTMDHRYGAWAQLLTLFRLLHDGAAHGTLRLPARHGHLFNPDRYPFLEGRAWGTKHDPRARIEPPMISDGVIYRVLDKLLVLDGERLSYRTLDVEQIGSVYETMMGFNLVTAEGPSIAVRPKKAHGAPLAINLAELLDVAPKDRGKWFKERTEHEVPAAAVEPLKSASTPEDLVAALAKKLSKTTPQIVPEGAMLLQPSDERRRSGSHYTPRSLTEPIVRTTLEPVLKRLGEKPTPEQILDLNVCDPAMGSGAFLVETCRQLGKALVKAWHDHAQVPRIPPDEDEDLFACRLVAQRCLYGVDRNPFAVDLAKLSLWLATLAKDHAFTFLDHALRHGDSLVGLTAEQIAAFDWGKAKQLPSVVQFLSTRIKTATSARREILAGGDFMLPALKAQKLKVADEALSAPRMAGDACIAAFFSEDKDKKREEARSHLARDFSLWIEKTDTDALKRLMAAVEDLKQAKGLPPFHWEIEFPEVFGGDRKGFDAIVGNPPYAGKNTLINGNPSGYLDWLKALHEESHGNSDLVAHFFRRAFGLLHKDGCFGLIASNTLSQGDTRFTGLRWICTHGGIIYAARKRYKWPGQAAVIVSVVHVTKGQMAAPFDLNGRSVPTITAFLFHAGGHENPATLAENASKSFIGSYVLGMGFTFDDSDTTGAANSTAEMRRLIERNPRNAELIHPFVGGEEVNDSPSHAARRYIINFGDRTEAEAKKWPDLLRIVEEKVRPDRQHQASIVNPAKWWKFARPAADLYSSIQGLDRVLACPIISNKLSFVFLPADHIFSHKLCVFPFGDYASFCQLQCRCHEVWAFSFSSTMKDDLNYSPTDCFGTFPFLHVEHVTKSLEAAGESYYGFRANLMLRNDEGLTKTYNRFHNPEESSPEILRLRELHAAMDRAVLNAYGWTDLQPTCKFLLDYEDEEDEDNGGGRKRKKPWRYRWPDEFRDEVLARLLDLNRQRAEEEQRTGAAAEAASKPNRSQGKGRGGKRGGTPSDTGQKGFEFA